LQAVQLGAPPTIHPDVVDTSHFLEGPLKDSGTGWSHTPEQYQQAAVMQSTLLVIRPGHRWLRATTTVRQHQANGSTHLHPKPIRVPVPVRRIAIPVVFASAECSRGLPFRRQVVELSIGFDFFRGTTSSPFSWSVSPAFTSLFARCLGLFPNLLDTSTWRAMLGTWGIA